MARLGSSVPGRCPICNGTLTHGITDTKSDFLGNADVMKTCKKQEKKGVELHCTPVLGNMLRD